MRTSALATVAALCAGALASTASGCTDGDRAQSPPTDASRGSGATSGVSGGLAGAAGTAVAADAGGGARGDDAGGTGSAGGACPAGLPGPALVKVLAPSGSVVPSYCMDATEVTKAHYAAFLAARPAISGQPVDCMRNATYEPEGAWPAASGEQEHPVVYVD
jgi:hypothetical protein